MFSEPKICKVKITLFLLSFFSLSLFAQQVKFIISNAPEKAVLLEIKGEEKIPVDTLFNINGVFAFSASKFHEGFYRLRFEKGKSVDVDFALEAKDAVFTAEYENLPSGFRVEKSDCNKLYFDFLKTEKTFEKRTALLKRVLAAFPDTSAYYSATLTELKNVRRNYEAYIAKITRNLPANSFVARYLRSAAKPPLPVALPLSEEIEYLKKHALDGVDFSDGDLIYSDLFTKKTIEYLGYYKNRKLSAEELVGNFRIAADTLLNKAKANRAVYEHVAEYLLNGFSEYGFNSVVDYVIDKYVVKDDLQINTRKLSLKKRINQAKYFKIGSIVPNIILPDTSGNIVNLYDLDFDRKLILFYASWCPHCSENLPALVKLYNEQKEKKVEILAVSIDTKRKDWIKVIRKFGMNFLNVSDLKGWNGKTSVEYFLYATPTIFVIDKKNKILAKPTSIDEIKEVFYE